MVEEAVNVGRGTRACCAALLAAVLLGAGAGKATAAGCPNAAPSLDYNCPLGPARGGLPLSDFEGWRIDKDAYRGKFGQLDNTNVDPVTVVPGDLDGDGVDELFGRAVDGEIQVYRFDRAQGDWLRMAVTFEGGARFPYNLVRTGNIDRDPGDELLVLTEKAETYKYTPATTMSGSFRKVSDDATAPLGGTGGDRSNWSTIRLTGLGAPGQEPAKQLIVRGSDGLRIMVWSGTTWLPSATIADLRDSDPVVQPGRHLA